MTVYKAIKPEATIAADMAIAAVLGDEYQGNPTQGKPIQLVRNGSVVPGMLLEPIPVTREKIASVIIKDGFYTVEDICTPEYYQACQQAGIR